jgi:hypothetical protein
MTYCTPMEQEAAMTRQNWNPFPKITPSWTFPGIKTILPIPSNATIAEVTDASPAMKKGGLPQVRTSAAANVKEKDVTSLFHRIMSQSIAATNVHMPTPTNPKRQNFAFQPLHYEKF